MSCVKYEDFNLICRLCLRKVAALTRFGDLPKNQNLSFIETILEVHLNFKISVVDDKPQNICKGCILQLFKTCHFLQMCIKSNNSLDEALEQENIGGTELVDHAVSDPLDNSNQENFASDSNKLCEDNETCTVPFVKVEGGSETSINRNEWNSGDLLEIVKNDVSSFDDDNVPIKIEDYEDEPSGLSSSANAPFEQPDISDEHNIPSFKKRSFTNTINDKSRSIKKNVNSKKRSSKNLQSTVKKKSIETLNNDDIVSVLKMNWGQKQGDWTSEQDSILIDFVKTYECLYNVQCKDYRKTELKQNLWNEIGGILDKTEDSSYEFTCRICMETLPKFSEVLDHFDKKHSGCRKCIICEKYYSHKPTKVIKYHMSKHRRKQYRFDCQKCVTYFLTKQEMTRHNASEEHNADPRVCKVCKKKFRNHSTMLNHMGLHTNEKKFKCTTCGQSFTHKGSLCRHISTTHDGFKVLCSLCGRAFTTKVALDIHTRVVHQGDKTAYLEQYARVRKKRDQKDADGEPDEKETKCRYCNEDFYSDFKRKQHESLKHQMTHEYKCRLCSQVFPSPKARNAHLHAVHYIFKCAQCFRGYSTQEKLDSHLEMHNQRGANTKCPVCGLECRFKANVEKHMRTHTGATPYVCDKCGKRFRQAINLRYHQFKHTQKRPYSCHLCSKVFTQKNFLDSHLNVHAGKYPYPCKLCEKEYPSQRALTKHMKRIHKEVKTEAVAEDKGEKAFVCEFCGKDYAVKGNLAKHVRKVHKEAEPAVSTPVTNSASCIVEGSADFNKYQYSY